MRAGWGAFVSRSALPPTPDPSPPLAKRSRGEGNAFRFGHVTMDLALLGQYVMNGVMLGMMYALVAVGFTLFFGVLDIIQFSHGDVLAFGAFVALAGWAALAKLGVASAAVQLVLIVVFSALATAAVGALVARFVVLPLKGAPSLNVLLVTLMMGTVLREAIRLFYPGGSQPQR